MTTSERHPGAWFDLRGQEICAVQGSYFNQTVAQQQLLSLQIYSSAREAKQALHDGRCAGWLFDQPAIDWALSQEDGSSYASTVPPLLNVSWAMALPRVERGGRLHRWLQNQMGQWHQEGYLLKLEQRWHLRPTAYLADMHQRWSHSSSGSPPCGSQNQGDWPSECLTGLQSGDVDLLHPQTLQWWLSGLLHTLGLLLACVMISLLMGLALWRWLMAQSARMQWASRMILGGLRLTPPLLVMGLFFYGIGGWLKLHIGWQPSGTLIATLCLSAYAGASVFLALDQTRQHLATSGLEPPGHQVIALAWPAIKGVLVNVSKATMMASALAVPELLSVSTSLMAETGQVHGVMNLMLVTYVALGLIIMGLLDHLEQRWRLRSKD
jgi:polar amino acid transport system substrate-binding protein